MMEKFSPPFLLLLLAVVGIILSLAGSQSAAAGCGGVASFADMTVVRGVDYLPVAIGSRSAGRDIREADLGPAFDSITVSLGCSPPAQGNYSTRLNVGTKLYALKSYLPEFHLSDGTFSYLLYDPKTGWTDKNILLPPAFATLIEKAVLLLKCGHFSLDYNFDTAIVHSLQN